MWVYLGDKSQPYNVFHFTESRKRDGPLEFLRDYKEVLVADAYGGYNGVVAGNAIRRGGCHAHYLDTAIIWTECAETAQAGIELVNRSR
jgi:hypothetical protein